MTTGDGLTTSARISHALVTPEVFAEMHISIAHMCLEDRMTLDSYVSKIKELAEYAYELATIERRIRAGNLPN